MITGLRFTLGTTEAQAEGGTQVRGRAAERGPEVGWGPRCECLLWRCPGVPGQEARTARATETEGTNALGRGWGRQGVGFGAPGGRMQGDEAQRGQGTQDHRVPCACPEPAPQ